MKYGFASAVGDMPSSKGFPSLATVVERFLPMPLRKRDCLGLDSVFEVTPFSLLWLLMRKKFLSFCGKWLEPLVLDDVDRPEKFRFSAGIAAEFGVEDPKSCVIAVIAVTVDIGCAGCCYQGELLEAWLWADG